MGQIANVNQICPLVLWRQGCVSCIERKSFNESTLAAQRILSPWNITRTTTIAATQRLGERTLSPAQFTRVTFVFSKVRNSRKCHLRSLVSEFHLSLTCGLTRHTLLRHSPMPQIWEEQRAGLVRERAQRQ